METTIARATAKDLPEILKLQKLAYLSEAKLLNDDSIQPLTQTPQELENEFQKTIILKLIDENTSEIIGSVRAYEQGGRVYIGKLMTRPDYQNRGFGTRLLKTIERYFDDEIFELYTSAKSEKNLALYKKNGYKEFKREQKADNCEFVYLEKRLTKKSA
jgi:GNAT superfamily N-acetyltransferase